MTEQNFRERLALGINQIEKAEDPFKVRLMRSLRLELLALLEETTISEQRKLYLIHLLSSGDISKADLIL